MAKELEDCIRRLKCPRCLKKRSSKTRGKYYAQLKRMKNHKLYILLTCTTCKYIEMYRVKEIEQKDKRFMKLGTGPVLHCFRMVHRIYVSKKHVIVGCLKCKKKQYFRREDNGKEKEKDIHSTEDV